MHGVLVSILITIEAMMSLSTIKTYSPAISAIQNYVGFFINRNCYLTIIGRYLLLHIVKQEFQQKSLG